MINESRFIMVRRHVEGSYTITWDGDDTTREEFAPSLAAARSIIKERIREARVAGVAWSLHQVGLSMFELEYLRRSGDHDHE